MERFNVLVDPVRRRILELLASGEQSSGKVANIIVREFRICQPAVSQHLKVLRENNFTTVRINGAQRLYNINPKPLQEIDKWIANFRHFWDEKLDALAEEIERGKRKKLGD